MWPQGAVGLQLKQEEPAFVEVEGVLNEDEGEEEYDADSQKRISALVHVASSGMPKEPYIAQKEPYIPSQQDLRMRLLRSGMPKEPYTNPQRALYNPCKRPDRWLP